MSTTGKILWITLGVVAIGGVFIYSHQKAKKKKLSRSKPKPQTISQSGSGSTVSEPDWGSPFDMNYADEVIRWMAPRKVIQLSPARASQIAEKLYKAKGASWYEDDDEEAVWEVFQKLLRDGVQVANTSRKFYWLYQKDLWEYLSSFLSESEMERYVAAPIRNLPPYRLNNN